MDRARIDWTTINRVLVVRLRSIGDTVLSTPSLIALRRFLPAAKIDILLEDWVAPILDGFTAIDEVLAVGGGISRLSMARLIRHRSYDIVFNLHGGTTATFFTVASGARHRVGYRNYQYSFLYNHLLSSPADFWKRNPTHSAEQQLGLLGFTGVPVDDLPKTRLAVVNSAASALERKFRERSGLSMSDAGTIAMLHPTAAFSTKEWAAENFSRVAEFLAQKGMIVIAVAAGNERHVLESVRSLSTVPVIGFDDLTLPEVTALAARADLFVGNDSGIAHIAAAVGTPSVVIFGSSNRDHWRPWTEAPNEIVFEPHPCQPCPGYQCREFGEPRCIQSVTVGSVNGAIDRVLGQTKRAAAFDRPDKPVT